MSVLVAAVIQKYHGCVSVGGRCAAIIYQKQVSRRDLDHSNVCFGGRVWQ